MHKRLAGVLDGGHAGLGLGPGSDPEEVVPYRPGEDDVRRIDWNVTARSAEPHVWRTRAEHELETWVLVDETASMDFGTVEVEKGELAAWVTGAVGLLSDGPGNRMGVLHLRADGLAWSPALPPRRAAYRALAGRPDPAPPRPPDPEQTSLGERPARPGPAPPAPGDPRRRQRLRGARRHRGAPLRLGAAAAPAQRPARRGGRRGPRPARAGPARRRPVVLSDPETGRRREVWTSSPGLREEYAALAAGHRAAVAEAVRAAGAGHVVLRTDRDWVGDLARFVRLRGAAPRPRRRRTR